MCERIKVAAWVDFHFLRRDWPAEFYHPAMLRERHFEPAKRQMGRERGLAVSLSTLDEIKDLPVWLDAKEGSRRDLSYYFSNLEGVLENRYSALSGFPLSWVVRDCLYTPEWSKLTSLRAIQHRVKADFFDFAHVDDIFRRMALIVPRTDNTSTKSEDKSVQDCYETGAKAECRTTRFLNDEEIVAKMLQLTFAGSVAAVHVKSIGRSCKKVSGRAVFV
jgi:hypothetical protein